MIFLDITMRIPLHVARPPARNNADEAHAIFNEETLGRLAGAGHYISRFFNVVEQMSLRVAKAFENNIDDEKGWHTELIRRMTLTLSGIRPALLL